MENMIHLEEKHIIGKGRDRICYEHPIQNNQCLKVSIFNDKQSIREVKYFKFLHKKNIDLSRISTFIGKVNTNKGIAYSFDLVRDHNGKVSKTLRQSLENEDFTLQYIQPKLGELKEYLISNKICARDISPSNISCRKTLEGLDLIIIDGISNSNINPLTIRLQCLVDNAIEKAWKGLDRKLARIEKALMSTKEK